jgi:hypothetical protein
MIINIIFNTFGAYHRQNIAMDSLRYLRQLYPDTIRLYNLQFRDEKYSFTDHYPDIEKKFVLSNSLDVVPGSTKKLPLMNEMFNAGLELDGDYFCFVNSDIILMHNAIQFILEKKPKAWVCSRMEILNIDSFQNIINQQITPKYYEVGGFDFFVFSKDWAAENRSLFQQPFLMAQPCFDPVWAGYIKVFGDATLIGNKFPPYLFHIEHNSDWKTQSTPEKAWNMKTIRDDKLSNVMYNVMAFNLSQNLFRRRPPYFNIPKEEEAMEQMFFYELNITRPLL